MSKPTVLLIHGAFHVPAVYDLLAAQLEDRGFDVERPLLPSRADPSDSHLQKDVDFIRKLLQDLIAQGKRILVVCHSYSGLVAPQAMHDLPKSQGGGDDKPGLVALVAMCALVLKAGQSVTKDLIEVCGFTDLVPQAFDIDPDTDIASVRDVNYMFGADIQDADEMQRLWKDVGTFPWNRALGTPVKYEGWRELPFTYVRSTERDTLVPKVYQDIMFEYFREVGGVKEEFLDTGHYPFIVMPDKVADIIQKAWDEATAS